ncbi:hypothetical protein CH371_11775 [Leptospira wolffii]|uniref:Uncharacterized protein n=1 Tax=Leptospira wolffii TaxID=409998 RepID=A0A2M9ZAZ9_9LEPT|nr:hypothetical protein CH371_11775 [Leptospira wolffii]
MTLVGFITFAYRFLGKIGNPLSIYPEIPGKNVHESRGYPAGFGMDTTYPRTKLRYTKLVG